MRRTLALYSCNAWQNRRERKGEVPKKRNRTSSTVSIAGRLYRRAAVL